jgi:hypothetical protein
MLGSKNRDYKTADRAVAVALDWHKKRMEELIEIGLGKEDASHRALKEYQQLPRKEHKRLIREWKEKHW